MRGESRRNVLAGLGAATIAVTAGCSVFDRSGEAEPPRLDTDEIERIVRDPVPETERPAPLQPDEASIEAGLERCAELIDAVPATITTEEIPNGVVREEVGSARESALDGREAVEDAPDRFRSLVALRNARADAREASVAYRAVGTDLHTEIEAERLAARGDVGARLARTSYAGDERDRTLLVAYRIEELLVDARRRMNWGSRPPDPGALDVGELAGDVEYAAATLDAVDALADRHASVAEEAVDFTATLESALESSLRAVSRADPPSRESTVEDVLGREPDRRDVRELAHEAIAPVRRWQQTLSTELSEGRLATGISRAIEVERDVRALEAVVDRIDGSLPEPDGSEPIRSERTAIVDAAEAAPISPDDRSLAGYVERGNDARLAREYAQYVHLRAQLEALPQAVEAVLARLDTR